MATSRIDIFNFINWLGPPPAIVQEQSATFHRPGADGVGQQTIGRWSDPFTVTLIHWESTYARAMRNAALMALLPGTGPVNLRYEGLLLHLPPWRHQYIVDHVRTVDCDEHALQLGPSINRAGGAQLVVEFTLTPHALF